MGELITLWFLLLHVVVLEAYHCTFEQNTWGRLGGPTPLMDSIQFYRKFDAPSVGIPETQYAGEPVRKGAVTSLFRSEMTYVMSMHYVTSCPVTVELKNEFAMETNPRNPTCCTHTGSRKQCQWTSSLFSELVVWEQQGL